MEDLRIPAEYVKDFGAAPRERKHIILLDGTWNDETGLNADGLVTNIVNLNRILKDDPEQQIVRYHRGVGNDNDNRWIGQNWKGVTGKTVGKIVEQAYARFVQDWQKGDHIYIFGFSRGAAAARMLASKIQKEGIPERIRITLRPKENAETKVVEQIISDVEIPPSAKHFVEIEFLGVWDTVSAFGLPTVLSRFFGGKPKDLFTDNHIAANIQRAVHLVAIDETRNPFVPSLMNHKPGVTHEVWFPGVHSDIGGSYAEDSIAKASLHYMMKQLLAWNKERNRREFLIHDTNYRKYAQDGFDQAYFHFHGNNTGKSLRTIGVQVDGKLDSNLKPKIHALHQKIASDKNSFSVIEVKGPDDKKETKYAQFQYMPFNVKMLRNKYEVVE
ncbi:MAG: DUF2235 domain-containing protein [Bacteroidetes bacterium]|nr:DUF2235 domain-containing protein [Bacteroidota bacterium]